jgi:hypothetical protein
MQPRRESEAPCSYPARNDVIQATEVHLPSQRRLVAVAANASAPDACPVHKLHGT